ncbi:hypothetical protein LJR225_000215 [Phenylobacterium sp. LjRoot225]|uniref:hypothetical protein n=1 Tax=Phenylobacterium sp. LjRoot225 TaxID=3342285 RepID=UPI003ECEC014
MIRIPGLLALAAAWVLVGPAQAQPAQVLNASEVQRWSTPEATQGVAVDRRHLYAIANSKIAKYDRETGRKVAEWVGERARYPHLNSCIVRARQLVCAGSNFPATPMTSSVEIFNPKRMIHLRTISLGQQVGSLTWVDHRDGAWWAAFANYDGKGGEPGHGHKYTQLVKFDAQWRRLEAWSFPASVLERFAPASASGGAWGEDGLLYVTGHDRPEVYVLRLPKGGSTLDHVATIAVPIEGQAIAFDRSARRRLFGISRPKREVVAVELPRLAP